MEIIWGDFMLLALDQAPSVRSVAAAGLVPMYISWLPLSRSHDYRAPTGTLQRFDNARTREWTVPRTPHSPLRVKGKVSIEPWNGIDRQVIQAG